jgi:hypothetical protein
MPRSRPAPAPPILTFRVRIRGGYVAPTRATPVWRDIEVAANQTLVAFGDAIPLAFDFSDPHLWSFFLSGKPWDRTTEYARQGRAARVRVGELPFPDATGTREVLFLFDYGDEWHFGVKLRHTSPTVDPRARYPRVVDRHGHAPPQYPELEDEEGEEAS